LSTKALNSLPRALNECIGYSISNRDLRQFDFNGLVLCHSHFSHTDFRQVEFIGTNFNDAVFEYCDFTGATFVYAHLEHTRFVNCILENIKVLGTQLENVITEEKEANSEDRSLEFEKHYSVRTLYACGYLYEVYHWPDQSFHTEPKTIQPMVLLHGMSGHALDYEPLVQKLACPVYAINLLGHGRSDYQSLRTQAQVLDFEHYHLQDEEDSFESIDTHEPYDESFDESFAEDEPREAPKYLAIVEQVKTLIEQLALLDGFQTFNMLGYSMGGRLALHLAHSFEKTSAKLKLKHLTLMSAGLGIEDKQERKIRQASDRQWSDALWNSQDCNHFLSLWNQHPLLARLAKQNPLEAQRVLKHRSAHRARGLALAFDSMGQGEMPPMHKSLAELECELLWVTGAEDPKYVTVAQQALTLSRGKHISIQNCGHAPHLEHLSRFCSELKDDLPFVPKIDSLE
jgi:2-succinyl-6-hydroxy-2,4-cyclohexadiene-1-carboxylate synthase